MGGLPNSRLLPPPDEQANSSMTKNKELFSGKQAHAYQDQSSANEESSANKLADPSEDKDQWNKHDYDEYYYYYYCPWWMYHPFAYCFPWDWDYGYFFRFFHQSP